jgi:hypothetical protein
VCVCVRMCVCACVCVHVCVCVRVCAVGGHTRVDVMYFDSLQLRGLDSGATEHAKKCAHGCLLAVPSSFNTEARHLRPAIKFQSQLIVLIVCLAP